MQSFLQAAVLGVLAAVLATLLKRNSKDLALVLTIAACCIIGVLVVRTAEPIVDFLGRLQGMTGLDAELMVPMLKAVGIGLLTEIAAGVCADAGESAIGKLVELAGGLLALSVALPLLEAVLQMLKTMGGG